MVNFESTFDIGEKVRHYITKEVFVVSFITFSVGSVSYQCHGAAYVCRPCDMYTFEELELESVEE